MRQARWQRVSETNHSDELRDIIRHAWIHSAYPDCGFLQMTTRQKRLYEKVIGRVNDRSMLKPPTTYGDSLETTVEELVNDR